MIFIYYFYVFFKNININNTLYKSIKKLYYTKLNLLNLYVISIDLYWDTSQYPNTSQW